MFVSTAFITESVIVLISAATPGSFEENFSAFQSVFLTVNLVSLVAILHLFTRIVSKSKQTFDSTRSRQSSRHASAKRLKKKDKKVPRGKSYLNRVHTSDTYGTSAYTSGTSGYSGHPFGGLADPAYAGGRHQVARKSTGTPGTHGSGFDRIYTGSHFSGKSGFSAFSKFSSGGPHGRLMGHACMPTASGVPSVASFETESSMPSFLPPTPALVRTPLPGGGSSSVGQPRRKTPQPLPVTREIPQFDLMSQRQDAASAAGAATCRLHTRLNGMDAPVRVRTAPLEEGHRFALKRGPVKSLTRPGSRMDMTERTDKNTTTQTIAPSQSTGRLYDFVEDHEASTVSFTEKQYSVNASSYHARAFDASQNFDMNAVVREPSMLKFDPSSGGSSLSPAGGGGSLSYSSNLKSHSPSPNPAASVHQRSASSHMPSSRYSSNASAGQSQPSLPHSSATPSIQEQGSKPSVQLRATPKPKRRGLFSFLPSFGWKRESRQAPDLGRSDMHYPYAKQPSTASCSHDHDDRSTPSDDSEHKDLVPDMVNTNNYHHTSNFTNHTTDYNHTTTMTTDKSTTRFALSKCPPSVTAPVPPMSSQILAHPRPKRLAHVVEGGSGVTGRSIVNDIDPSMSTKSRIDAQLCESQVV